MVRVRMRDEDGAVTVIVAVFITVLFGFVALAVDVARMYEEKAQLESTSDLSVLAGSQLLWKSKADAELAGETFVTENPTVNHPGAYNELTGDLVEAKRTQEGTGCRADVSGTGTVTLDPTGSIPTSQLYDCVQSKVESPFEFLFASVLGFQDRKIASTSTAFMGNGAPRGTTIVPFLLRDCPNSAEYNDSATPVPSGCPYRFTDSFVNDPSSPFITIFQEGANFQGAVMPYEEATGGCPLRDGFDSDANSGNAVYQSVLQDSAGFTPCRVAPGMRLQTRGLGAGQNQLQNSLIARGINTSTCANQVEFDNALARTGDGDGFVTIKQRNACLVNVMFVVHSNGSAASGQDVSGTPATMQATDSASRFANFSGTGQRVVVRRLAWYYITGFSDGKPIGVYLRAVDNDNSILHGPMDLCPAATPISECAQHGIYIVKLVN